MYDEKGRQLSIDEVTERLPSVAYLQKVNRVEVVDRSGRAYTNWKPTNNVEISFQDNQRTLKVFIS